ncbi:MAG: repeat-like domain, partial [Verrucomicrobiota bacterium]
MKQQSSQSAFFAPRVFISFLLIFGAILLAFGGGGISPTPSAQAGTQISSGAVTQTLNVPFLTMGTAPDVFECRGILRQEIIDLVNSAPEDPAVTFEQDRRAHPHMIMMPPPLECASSMWREVRTPGGKPSVDADAINSRQYAAYSVFNSGPLAALVGTNINPASGVEGYQGETNIAIDPNNPLHMVAHSNTFFKDTTAQCQSPTGGTASTFGTMALFGSTDGGATWTYNCAPWPASVTGGVTGATFWFGSDPALAWDNQGRAYATYMLISQSASASGAAIVTARSSDNGTSWQSLGT